MPALFWMLWYAYYATDYASIIGTCLGIDRKFDKTLIEHMQNIVIKNLPKCPFVLFLVMYSC